MGKVKYETCAEHFNDDKNDTNVKIYKTEILIISIKL